MFKFPQNLHLKHPALEKNNFNTRQKVIFLHVLYTRKTESKYVNVCACVGVFICICRQWVQPFKKKKTKHFYETSVKECKQQTQIKRYTEETLLIHRRGYAM